MFLAIIVYFCLAWGWKMRQNVDITIATLA